MAKRSAKIFLIWNKKEQVREIVGSCQGFFVTFEGVWETALRLIRRSCHKKEDIEIWEIDLLKNTKTIHILKEKDETNKEAN